MKLNLCFLFLLLGATLIQAIPISKATEKKSLTEDSKVKITKENLKVEEIGEEKDRSKKAAFCLQIEPSSSQASQIGLNENQLPIQNIPLTVQTQFVPQQVQTLNLVQPTLQSLSEANNIVFPQQIQPLRTLQIVQPSVPIQSTLQADNLQADIKSVSKPEQTSTIDTEQHATEQLKSMRIKKHPQPLLAPQEALSVLPVVPTYQDLMLISDNEPKQTTFVQVPTISCNNYLHRTLAECTCQKMEPMAMNMLPIVPYSPTYVRSSLVMPHALANVSNK